MGTRMEEIQKRLAEQAQSAKFTNELRECRVREGMKAKFEASFAGNPPPTFSWTFNGQEIVDDEKHRIRIRGNKVSLTLFEVTMDMTGYYICVAKNDLGTDTTRAGLTVNKALSAEEKARLEELAEAEKNKALQKKKDAEEKKKKMEELAQQQKEQQRLQQEQRKSARAAKAQKEKEPAKEPEKVALKKRPERAQEPAQEQPKELPKLKKVETVKRESPVRRSQSPIPQLRRVEQQKRDSRENTPLRAQSPIPNLRPVPKKGSPAPGKAKTQVVKKQVTAKTDSNKQSDSIDTTVKQSHSDIELHKKEKNDSKPIEITPQHEVSETVDKTSPTKGELPETVNKSKYPHEENQK